MTTLDNAKTATFYICEYCDYKTPYKSHYTEHLHTRKHYTQSQNNNASNANPLKPLKKYPCKYCDKSFNDRAGLWRHNKKCNNQIMLQTIVNELVEVKKQNAELKQMFETQNQIIASTNNNNNNLIPSNTITGDHNNIQNNIFNTQVFLETECKNAVNMKDFLDNISIDINELDFIKDNKRVESITNIFLKHLNNYGVNERPIHCTDIKRLSLYVKDNDTWFSKEQGTTKFSQSINDITKIAVKSIPDWEHHNKDIMNQDDLDEGYFKLVKILNSPIEEKESQKIMKNIASNVKIGKGSETPF